MRLIGEGDHRRHKTPGTVFPVPRKHQSVDILRNAAVLIFIVRNGRTGREQNFFKEKPERITEKVKKKVEYDDD